MNGNRKLENKQKEINHRGRRDHRVSASSDLLECADSDFENRRLFGSGFCAGQAGLQEFDLAVVIGFVFGDVEPFAIIIGAEIFVDDHEPLVVALLQFRERMFARFVQECSGSSRDCCL